MASHLGRGSLLPPQLVVCGTRSDRPRQQGPSLTVSQQNPTPTFHQAPVCGPAHASHSFFHGFYTRRILRFPARSAEAGAGAAAWMAEQSPHPWGLCFESERVTAAGVGAVRPRWVAPSHQRGALGPSPRPPETQSHLNGPRSSSSKLSCSSCPGLGSPLLSPHPHTCPVMARYAHPIAPDCAALALDAMTVPYPGGDPPQATRVLSLTPQSGPVRVCSEPAVPHPQASRSESC